jgi:plasmid stability protein
MEAEVRAILEDVLHSEPSSGGLGSRIHARFAAIGGLELDPPVRKAVDATPRQRKALRHSTRNPTPDPPCGGPPPNK